MSNLFRVLIAALLLAAGAAPAQLLQPNSLLLGATRVEVLYSPGPAAASVTAVLQDASGPRGMLTLQLADGHSEGIATLGAQRFQIQATPEGVQAVELPRPPAEGPGDAIQPIDDFPLARRAKGPGQVATAGNPVVVDIMLLYTPAARKRKGGQSGIVNTINMAVAEANQCYADSGIYVVLNPVYTGELNFSESTSMSSDLGRMAVSTEVDTLRTQYKADLVNLMIDSTDMYAGIAYVLTGTSTWGYSLVQAAYGYGYFVFAHELGHNFGAMHDRANSSFAPATPYGYGYRFNASGQFYRTVMAYDPGIRIGYFSTPLKSFLGVPVGVANSEDVARLINERAGIVAGFQDAPGYTVQLARNGTGSILYNGAEAPASITPSRGALVTLTAASGNFLVWSGAVVSTNRTIRFVPGADSTLTAHFADGTQPLAPQITRQPKSLNVPTNGSIVLTADGYGIPAPTFQWKREGVALGQTGKTLRLDNAAEAGSGAYWCELSNPSGTVQSDLAIISVGRTPVFVQQPASQYGQIGGNAIFSTLLNTPEEVAYQWYFGETPIPLATNQSLMIFSIVPAYMGTYHVEATTPLYHVRSESAQLLMAAPPLITRQPERVEVTKGGNAVFSVEVAGIQPIYYQWRFNGNDLAGQTNDTLSLTQVQTNYAGVYSVQLSNPQGITTSTNATLVVYNPLVILRQPVDLLAAKGDMPIFSVAADGSPPITYQWFRQDASLTNQVYSTCRLRNVQPAQAGIYWVEIKNPAGSILSEQAVLTVIQPPVFTQQPQSVVGDEGGAAAFSVAVDGLAPFDYQWYKGAAALPGQTGPALSLGGLTAESVGWYSVRVSNTDGVTNSAAALLQIVTAPVITQQPAGDTLVKGATAYFGVSATGAAPLSYAWMFNGAPLSGAVYETLQLGSVQPAQAGAYTVWVSNRLGRVQSAVAQLVVLDPPRVTLAGSLSADEGSRLVITPVVTGAQPLSYTWKKGAATLASGAGSPGLVLASLAEADAGVYTFIADNAHGQDSKQVNVTVNLAPRITQQPAAASGQAGSTVSFLAGARGATPMVYYWYRDTNFAAATTDPVLILQNLSWDMEAAYHVVVSNRIGTAVSSNASLTILEPPRFTLHPQSLTAAAGQTATLSAAATGRPPLTYTWYKNNSPAGATQTQLALGALAPASAGVYCVKASNRDGETFSSNAVVVVVSPPVITTQPASQTVVKGAPVTFTVQVSSAGAVTLQWFKDDVALAGASGAQLVLSSCQPSQAGGYTVSAANLAGSVTSARAVLVVKDPPVLVQQPAAASATCGQSVTFGAYASGKLPLAWQWYKAGQAIPGATAASLVLSSVTRASAGSYSARVTNSDGTASTSPALLTYVADPPVITGLPASVTVVPGRTLSFQPSVAGHSPMTNIWYLNGTLLVWTNTASLVISNIQESQADSYQLAVANDDGAAVSALIPVRVTYDPPVITTQPADVRGCRGMTVVFSVQCANSGALTYQWYKNQTLLIGETNSALAITNVGPGDVAAYKVLVSNDTGVSSSQSATLQILPPPSIVQQPSDVTVARMGTAAFSASAAPPVEVKYQWFFNDAPLAGATNDHLTLTQVQPSQAGSYKLRVANESDTVFLDAVFSNPALLTVLDPPVITLQPQGATVAVGTPVTLSLGASGLMPMRYQWYLNSALVAGATQASVVISSAQASHSGTWFVTVSNVFGRVSSATAALSVQAPPVVTTQPRAVTIARGASTSLDIQASGYGNLSYQWYLNDQPVSGATGPSCSISSASAAHEGLYYVRVRNSVGEAVSQTAAVKVLQPPLITSQPAAATYLIGGSAALSVTAVGRAPITCQWQKVRVSIPGATAATLALSSMTSADDALYRVLLSNADGSATSAEVRLQLDPSQIAPPGITRHPADTKALRGTAATLVADVSGTPAIFVRWRKDGVFMASATNKTYAIASLQDAQLGRYDLVATNAYGWVTSTVARVEYAQLPGLTQQPVAADIIEGATLRLSAAATNATSYQWMRSSAAVAGQTLPALVISNTIPSMGGSYSLRAYNAWGSVDSASVMVYVRAKPAFSTQPSGQTLNRAGTLSLYATATGDGVLTCQWYRDGALLSGAASSSLVINNIQVSQAGAYWVVASSPYGAATSQVAQVIVKDPPIITGQAMGCTVKQGDPFSITISVSGKGPFTYRWVRNGATVVVSGGPTYSIAQAAPADAGDYYIVFSDPDGTYYSPLARVVVRLAPAITTACQSLILNRGTNLLLQPAAVGEAPISWQWQLNGADIPGATGLYYARTNVQLLDSGTYSVRLANAIATNTANIAVVVVKDPPVITRNPVSAQAIAGDSVTFDAAASGATPMSWQWKKDGVILTNAVTNPLVISGVSASNAGIYTVVAQNVDGAAESAGAVLSLGQPPFFIAQPGAQRVPYGGTLSLSAAVAGTAPITFQWSRDGVSIPGCTSTNLVAGGATPDFEGAYTLRAVNAFGQTSSVPAVVTVIYPPLIKVQPAPVTANQGANTAVEITVAGREPMTYVWKRNGAVVVGPNSRILSFNNVQPGSAGVYSVSVSNADGALESGSATLVVRPLPVITRQPEVAIVTVSNDLRLSVQATAAEALAYCWFKDGKALTRFTQPDLLITNAAYTDAGLYTVAVGSSIGTVMSEPAIVLVLPTQPIKIPSNQIQPVMLAVVPLKDGSAGLLYHGAVGRNYEIQVSTNLTRWDVLTTVSLIKNVNQFIDKDASKHPGRFYRARLR